MTATEDTDDELRRLRRLLEVGRALTAELDLDVLLRRVLEAGREVCGARYAALGVLDAERRSLAQFLTLGEGPEVLATVGHLPRGQGVLGVLIDEPAPLRLHDVSQHPRSYGFPAGHPPMRSFLGAPVLIRGAAWGNLYLTEKKGGDDFTDADVDAIVVLAQWAAIAIGNARSVEARRLSDQLAAAEGERARWARELHDQTLQGLGGMKLALAAARRATDPTVARTHLDGFAQQLTDEIAALRAIIADLRPGALDELGLEPALRTLAETVGARSGLAVDLDLGDGPRLPPEVETIAYRVVQEALTNVVKHAQATRAQLRTDRTPGRLVVEISDDGEGLRAGAPGGGYGLVGMRERAALGGGTLELVDGDDGRGTLVRLTLPVDQADG